MTYALAVNELEGIWRVYCNVCRVDMGTMSITTLKAALAFAVERGGVMCSDCRTKRCKRCGIGPVTQGLKNGWCVFCIWEMELGGEEVFGDTQSCLVNLKSRDPGERD